MQKVINLRPLFIASALLLNACGGSDGESSTPAPGTPTPTPTAAPSPSPSPSPTPTPTPSVTPAPTDGTVIIDTSLQNAAFWGGDGDNNTGAVGTRAVVDVDHELFDKAVRITVNNPTGVFWNGQLQFPITTAVNAGDVVLAHFYMRSIANTYETGSSFVSAFLEDNTTYDKFLNREVSAADEWQEYYLPASITTAQSAGNLALKFGFGGGDRPQTFELAGIELLNYGDYDIALLPATAPTYVGREPDASWREAANTRIEQTRKGDFTITVLDANGETASGASLDVKLQKHAYHFGSVTVGSIINGTSADSATYRETVLDMFNQSGPENDLKWGPWIGEWGNGFNKTSTLTALQWLRDNGLYTRGHVMVWPSKRNLPNLIAEQLPDDPANAPASIKQEVLDHIDDIGSDTRNYVDEWDVLNEPYDNHYLMDAFGDSVMVDWFNRARLNLPSHGLFLNDYSILSAGGRNIAHQQHFEDTIAYLVSNNAPITGIGMQSHFDETLTPITAVYDILERYHTAFPDLDIRTTEFDITTDDEALQADYTRDFLTIFFSHPATVGVQLWGFWEGAHWNPKAAMFASDWRAKPAATAWKTLTQQTWDSEFDATTDATGQFSGRGFYGDYSADITIDGVTRHFTFHLENGAASDFTLSFATPE